MNEISSFDPAKQSYKEWRRSVRVEKKSAQDAIAGSLHGVSSARVELATGKNIRRLARRRLKELAELPAEEAMVHDQRLQRITQALLEGAGLSRADWGVVKRRAVQLMDRMKKSTVQLSDFEDLAVLWGYTHIRFAERARATFDALHVLHRLTQAVEGHSEGGSRCEGESPHLPVPGPQQGSLQASRGLHAEYSAPLDAVLGAPRLAVVSVGGGPGNDLVGALLWLKRNRGEDVGESSFVVMDWAEGWGSIVQVLASVLQQEVQFTVGDVGESLQSTRNEAFLSALQLGEVGLCRLLLFSFVLHESSGWQEFMCSLFLHCGEGDIFFFVDPRPESQHSSLHSVLVLLAHAAEEAGAGVKHWWVVSGLFVLRCRPGCSGTEAALQPAT